MDDAPVDCRAGAGNHLEKEIVVDTFVEDEAALPVHVEELVGVAARLVMIAERRVELDARV